MQRLFDIIFSGLALIFLSPLLLVVAFILRVSNEGEVFFLQERVGKNGKSFKLFKFATMLKNSPNIGAGTITLKDDPRVLPIGRFLRKSKINELPQLLNVFIGNMSLIGPRPQTMRCFGAFPDILQKEIIRVEPGLSGIGSIVFRDEEKIISDDPNPLAFYDEVIAPYKGEIESWYVNNRTIQNYFILIFITIWVVICPNSNIVWILFKNLPNPPVQLKTLYEKK